MRIKVNVFYKFIKKRVYAHDRGEQHPRRNTAAHVALTGRKT